MEILMKKALFLGLCLLCPGGAAEPADPRNTALIAGALAQIGKTLSYDAGYRKLDYPGGDVPLETGVCSDVVVRAFRHVGIDLQVLVHRDMRQAFAAYPKLWGLRRPDPNIDHRRVPNLQTFLRRTGKRLPVSADAADYLPGDLVTWVLPGNFSHIGLVSDRRNADGSRFLIVHNMGRGALLEDMLFAFPITGHYRYFKTPPPQKR